MEDAVTWLLEPTRPPRVGQAVRLGNAYCVALASQDAEYGNLLGSSGVNLPDGMPVAWVMRLKTRRGRLRPQRVRGPSLFEQTLDASQSASTRHFLLGGTENALRRLEANIAARYPRVEIAGSLSPAFGPLTEETVDDWARTIRASGATLVWVGLGTPKQDHATTALAERLMVHCVGVGAAFDFLAGTRPEAPRWMQRSALEWLFRFWTEPGRLWRRYTIGNARFLMAIARKST